MDLKLKKEKVITNNHCWRQKDVTNHLKNVKREESEESGETL